MGQSPLKALLQPEGEAGDGAGSPAVRALCAKLLTARHCGGVHYPPNKVLLNLVISRWRGARTGIQKIGFDILLTMKL